MLFRSQAERESLAAKREEVRSELNAIQQEATTLMQRGSDSEQRVALNDKIALLGGQLGKLEEDLDRLGRVAVKEVDVVEAFTTLEEFWDILFPVEKQQVLHALIERVTLWPDGMDLKLKAVGVASLVADLTAYADEAKQRGECA